MKYIGCDAVESSLYFTLDTVRSCGMGYNDTEWYWYKNYNGELINPDIIKQKREQWRETFKSGKLIDQCKNCIHLIEKDFEENPKISIILIAHRTACSCCCYYCSFSKDPEWKRKMNTRKSYDILPVLLDLKAKDLLSDNLLLSIAGGECTEYPDYEFERLVQFAYFHGYKMDIYSSGFNYSAHIEKMLKDGLANIVISVDSGTKETYEKIKRVKKYEQVWENIKNYSYKSRINTPRKNELQNQNDCSDRFGQVTLKYVICKDVNDNNEEFDKFIEKCEECKIKNVRIALEYDWWNNEIKSACEKGTIPTKLIDFVNHIRSFDESCGILIQPTEFAGNLFNTLDNDKKYFGCL